VTSARRWPLPSRSPNKRKTGEADRQLGARIRHRRRVLGLSLSQLSAKVGVSYQQLHKYETGVNRVPAPRLGQLAEVLGVELASLLKRSAALERAERDGARAHRMLQRQRAFLALPESMQAALVPALAKA
jgi:transcriptional regulator with XRE-family HTH domain